MPVSFTARVLQMLSALVNPLWVDPATSRMRVVLDPLGGAQTLGTVTTVGTVNGVTTVTTVSTVTNQANIGGLPANGFVHDQMNATWAASVRRAVS
jgi:fructose-1,6-bisphosphatase